MVRIFLVVAGLSLYSAHTGQAADDVFARAIRHFGGEVVDPNSYDRSVKGFNKYLSDSGVQGVSAQELTTPHHPDVAARHGFTHLLPAKQMWPRGVALALLAAKIRSIVGEPVTIRNWWRPQTYNSDTRVKGAGRSDHLTAHSIDLDYRSAAAARKAEQWLRNIDRENRWLQLSIGVGERTTHVGIHSPLGRRNWRYP